MYTYYGLSTMGPEMQKHLWWKRHITHYQLVSIRHVEEAHYQLVIIRRVPRDQVGEQ